MNVTAGVPEGSTSPCLRCMLLRVSFLLEFVQAKPLWKKSALKMFIAYSPGSRLPASRGHADFRQVKRLKQTRMGHDSYPGLAVFSWLKLLASCQTLFSELNSTRLWSQPQQERFASCFTSDQTSARMSTRTARALQNLSHLLGLMLRRCQ